MKITDVTAYPVWVGHRNQCLIKVQTAPYLERGPTNLCRRDGSLTNW